MNDLSGVHVLTSIVVDDVSLRIDMNGVFEFTVTHETAASVGAQWRI